VDTQEDAKFLPLRESGQLYYQGIRRNQLSILLWVQTADARQKQARIMSYSGAKANNFWVGQQGKDIAFQLRTPLFSAYESGQELEAPASLESSRATLVAVVYDGRRARIYIDDRLAGEDDFGAKRIPFFRSRPRLGIRRRRHFFRSRNTLRTAPIRAAGEVHHGGFDRCPTDSASGAADLSGTREDHAGA
jgi:hypothetical protein